MRFGRRSLALNQAKQAGAAHRLRSGFCSWPESQNRCQVLSIQSLPLTLCCLPPGKPPMNREHSRVGKNPGITPHPQRAGTEISRRQLMTGYGSCSRHADSTLHRQQPRVRDHRERPEAATTSPAVTIGRTGCLCFISTWRNSAGPSDRTGRHSLDWAP